MNEALGEDVNHIQIKTEMFDTYEKYSNIKQMTDSVIWLQIILFIILSSIVIYAIMIADVEQ